MLEKKHRKKKFVDWNDLGRKTTAKFTGKIQ